VKEVQFFDYTNVRTPTPCADSVTAPCIDNAFSFFAKEYVWVVKTNSDSGDKTPLSVFEMLRDKETDHLEDFQGYGDKWYVTNLGARNVVVSVRQSDAQPYETWNGDQKIEDLSSASVHVNEKAGFSCSGCQGFGQAPSPLPPSVQGEQCGVPQACESCKDWQRVNLKGTSSNCRPTFVHRECVECPLHHMTAGAGKLTQYECVACPALKPMRRQGKTACAECEHTQYFDAKSTKGAFFLHPWRMASRSPAARCLTRGSWTNTGRWEAHWRWK
jgi:hypothetical protein